MKRLLDADQKLLLTLSRQTLEFLLKLRKEDPLDAFKKKHPLIAQEHRGCFITLYKPNEHLRGCIGTIAADTPLWKNVSEFTEKAAFQDPRFEPLYPVELPETSIHITVLDSLEGLPSPNDVVIGKHGLCVTFGTKRGVLLPDGALKFGWNTQEFMRQTCIKAGLSDTHLSDYRFDYFEAYSFGES